MEPSEVDPAIQKCFLKQRKWLTVLHAKNNVSEVVAGLVLTERAVVRDLHHRAGDQ